MRVRYETYCDGRLVKAIGQVNVTSRGAAAARDGTEFIDGQHWWIIDEQAVADDVAQAMLAKWLRAQQGKPPQALNDQTYWSTAARQSVARARQAVRLAIDNAFNRVGGSVSPWNELRDAVTVALDDIDQTIPEATQ